MVEVEVLKADIGRKHLDKICEKVLAEMLKEGVEHAKATVGHVDTGATINSIHSEQSGCEGKIVASGHVDEKGVCTAVWLEFGTGVLHNGGKGNYPHPKAQELGMKAIGTYGQGQGANLNGWHYYDANGKLRHTRGIRATKFMYNTGEYLKQHAQEITDKVVEQWSK